MGVAATIGRWRADRATARAYENLGCEERDALARDVGIDEGRLSRIVARGARAGEELPRLLQAVGVDIGKVGRADPNLLRDMQITCSTCSVVKACRPHLDSGVARLVYQDYCPNADTIGTLAGEPKGAR